MKKKTENYMVSHKMFQNDIVKKMFQYSITKKMFQYNII